MNDRIRSELDRARASHEGTSKVDLDIALFQGPETKTSAKPEPPRLFGFLDRWTRRRRKGSE